LSSERTKIHSMKPSEVITPGTTPAAKRSAIEVSVMIA
jgi:hypothetical protein